MLFRSDERFDQPVDTLSGGQKARLGLARLLLESPDLLLLDEPTNHLDILGRRWLENFLADEFHGAVVVISHDRWLLDRVVERIVEVEGGRVLEYPGNYQAFIKQRHERKLVEQRVHEKQLDRIRAEEAFIKKYKAGQRAKQARGREARLERYKRDELSEKPIELVDEQTFLAARAAILAARADAGDASKQPPLHVDAPLTPAAVQAACLVDTSQFVLR